MTARRSLLQRNAGTTCEAGLFGVLGRNVMTALSATTQRTHAQRPEARDNQSAAITPTARAEKTARRDGTINRTMGRDASKRAGREATDYPPTWSAFPRVRIMTQATNARSGHVPLRRRSVIANPARSAKTAGPT